ncbi:MAG: ANTAR domain-containing protein [Nitriliruptor sp.]|nr:MAG: ANTAR domain-containing protein [Nitriliruptor sp.]
MQDPLLSHSGQVESPVSRFGQVAERPGLRLSYTRLWSSRRPAAAVAHHGPSGCEAIQSRDIIGQAKGIYVERLRLTPADSFTKLAELSQHHNLPLRDIAEHIITTGEIPA